MEVGIVENEEFRRASEDIELIKSVLQRTTISFSTLRPAFLGLARLWLAYALIETAIWAGTLLTSAGTPLSFLLNGCNIALQWLLCIGLICFVSAWRRKLPNTGVDPLASRLAAIWGILILGYVGSRMLELAVFPLCFRLSGPAAGGEMGISDLQFTLCNQVLYYATTITFAALPILLTAVLFRSRTLGWLGIGALAVGVVWSVLWLFALSNAAGAGFRYLGAVLYRLLQFLPPVALFLFSSILKKQNITYLRRGKP